MAFKKGHKGYWKNKKRPSFSEEWKNKISKNNAKFWLGKKLPKNHISKAGRKRISEANKGEKSYKWKGGISKTLEYKRFMNKRTKFRRKTAKLNNGGSHTLGEWENLKAQYNWICPCCGKSESEIQLTEDHIIPLNKGGSDNIENIQPLCLKCNSHKRTKIIKYEI